MKYNYILIFSSLTAHDLQKQTAIAAVQIQYQNIIQMQFSVNIKYGPCTPKPYQTKFLTGN